MPVPPAQVTKADNVKHEIHYTLADRSKDVVVAAYTKVEGAPPALGRQPPAE